MAFYDGATLFGIRPGRMGSTQTDVKARIPRHCQGSEAISSVIDYASTRLLLVVRNDDGVAQSTETQRLYISLDRSQAALSELSENLDPLSFRHITNA